jgi:hypothetical protein
MKYLGMPTMLLCCLGLWACNLVLGTDDFIPSKCAVDKIDLVLGIDNSRSMADKQQILAKAIPDLVKGLVNPRCLSENGAPAQMQPSYPTDPCPAGTVREFEPVLDIHIGVTSSSIGGHGADSCPNSDSSKECTPNPNTTNNDQGHLLARLDQCGGQEAPTFMNKKFLAWDPSNKYGGETVIENGTMGIVPTLRDMVIGTGQIGCGYESQLESIYRFLADPNPYESIEVKDYKAAPVGYGRGAVAATSRIHATRFAARDCHADGRERLLHQRVWPVLLRWSVEQWQPARAFAPRSSRVRQGSQRSVLQIVRSRRRLVSGRSDLQGSKRGHGVIGAPEDNINLRCWDQKRRFGIDFLYPTDRYVQAFSSASILIATVTSLRTRSSRTSIRKTTTRAFATPAWSSSPVSSVCLGKTSRVTRPT